MHARSRSSSQPVDSPLWVIASYFNPCGYSRRLTNYRSFRRHLHPPLLTVELSFDGRFELREDDADLLVQLNGGHVMWQKERLFNVALENLPDPCDYVAWVDCDVLFDDDGWADRAMAALERHSVIQLFDRAYDLISDEPYPPEVRELTPKHSITSSWVGGTDRREDFHTGIARVGGGGLFGMAWAAHRSLLRDHGFYDRRIIGGGDRAVACAAMDRIEGIVEYQRMNGAQERHYRAWAEPFRDSVGRRVGFLPQAVYHLWHGDLASRKYTDRHAALGRFDFDPEADLKLGPNGSWMWGSDKPELHRFVSSYFAARNEDGEPESAGERAPVG